MIEAELTQRLERLERDTRRLKGFALTIVLLAAAFSAIYASRTVPEKITAQEFEVVDRAGEVRMTMETTSFEGRASRSLAHEVHGWSWPSPRHFRVLSSATHKGNNARL